MSQVKPQTLWVGNDRQQFQVIAVITDDQGHEWVHYRRVDPKSAEEYSCWTESFIHRFREIVQ